MATQRFTLVMNYLLLAVGGIAMLFPFVWMLGTSLKTPSELFVLPPPLLPAEPQWDNYRKIWSAAPFARYFMNSLAVTTAITVGELISSVLAAFAFARFYFFGKTMILYLLLGTLMIPGELLLLPNVVTITELGWIDRYEGLIVPWVAGAVAIYFLKLYFEACPRSYYEAARIDGASDLYYLCYIQLPLAVPALIVLALLKIIASWNAYIWPLMVTNSEEMRTVQIGLLAFSTEAGTQYELLLAASSIVVVPMIIVLLCSEKYIVQAIASGGLKG